MYAGGEKVVHSINDEFLAKDSLMEPSEPPVQVNEGDQLKHVGGITDDLGGVDPQIDEVLMRLSGGP